MVQEEVNQRVVSLCIRTARLTANVLAKAMMKYLEAQKRIVADHKRKAEEPSKGKQTLKELMEQNAGATNIEVDKSNIRSFERIARKYHIDYAVKKDKTMDKQGEAPRYRSP